MNSNIQRSMVSTLTEQAKGSVGVVFDSQAFVGGKCRLGIRSRYGSDWGTL